MNGERCRLQQRLYTKRRRHGRLCIIRHTLLLLRQQKGDLVMDACVFCCLFSVARCASGTFKLMQRDSSRPSRTHNHSHLLWAL